MGCDIHLYIERRAHKDLPWELDPNHSSYDDDVSAAGRNYSLFGRLAGVRQPDKQMFDQRDVPFDASEEYQNIVRDYGDGHSFSYLSLEEFTEAVVADGYDLNDSSSTDAFYRWEDYYGNNKKFHERPPDYTTVVRYCQAWLADEAAENMLLGLDRIPEIRLVFFFDN